jgi:biotin carboxyl carrier protein
MDRRRFVKNLGLSGLALSNVPTLLGQATAERKGALKIAGIELIQLSGHRETESGVNAQYQVNPLDVYDDYRRPVYKDSSPQQKLANAKAARDAQEEEDRYALAKAKSDVRLAELDVRKNPLLPALVAKQNDMALEAWGQHLTQLEQNLLNRKATGAAAIASQEAARGKAETQASVARQNIQAMSLKAKRDGYVSVKANTSGNFFFWGMTLPVYQIGDSVRPGMAVAEIPDMKNWEIAANIGELDRGHIALGEPVAITIIAAPMRRFRGHVSNLGGTTGPPWDRRFECKIQLDDPSSELRPGMSAQIVVTTDAMRNVLWLPSQALFESDGRTFVYVRSGATFSPKDVKLVRRSETRVVIEGLAEGQVVALANPGEMRQKKAAKGAMQSIPK